MGVQTVRHATRAGSFLRETTRISRHEAQLIESDVIPDTNKSISTTVHRLARNAGNVFLLCSLWTAINLRFDSRSSPRRAQNMLRELHACQELFRLFETTVALIVWSLLAFALSWDLCTTVRNLCICQKFTGVNRRGKGLLLIFGFVLFFFFFLLGCVPLQRHNIVLNIRFV